jgi:protein arginine kinase activator
MHNPPHVCPLTLKLCTDTKCITVTTVNGAKAVDSIALCQNCGLNFIKDPEAKIPEIMLEVPDSATGDQLVTIITNVDQLIDVLTGKGIPVEPPTPPKPPCPNCGLTGPEFNKTGRFGCAQCYTHYLDEFLALAGPFQNGADLHVGKTPKPKAVPPSNEDDIKALRLKITYALENEKYEDIPALKAALEKLEQSD